MPPPPSTAKNKQKTHLPAFKAVGERNWHWCTAPHQQALQRNNQVTPTALVHLNATFAHQLPIDKGKAALYWPLRDTAFVHAPHRTVCCPLPLAGTTKPPNSREMQLVVTSQFTSKKTWSRIWHASPTGNPALTLRAPFRATIKWSQWNAAKFPGNEHTY